MAAAGVSYSIPWPTAFHAFIAALRIFLVDVIAMTKAGCPQRVTFYTSLVVTLLGLKVVVLLRLGVPWAWHRIAARRRSGNGVSTAFDAQRQAGSSTHAVIALESPWLAVFRSAYTVLVIGYPGGLPLQWGLASIVNRA